MAKRKSEGPVEPAALPITKKARTTKSIPVSVTVKELIAIKPADMESLPPYTVIFYFTKLQQAYLAEKAHKLADMMADGIKKQMKWQPSCKTGGKRWTYEGMVPSLAVFYALFNLKEEKKEWKQKKIPLVDFQRITGGLYASIRYGSLRVVSENITLKFDKEN
ncbi:hypothetical protein BDZ45DRAFT_810028 [Acephala macrosclerotiorum]|nr:hypothetical protein BDZ45DRAFT_810028 [Acephala macrosclerotiorum]